MSRHGAGRAAGAQALSKGAGGRTGHGGWRAGRVGGRAGGSAGRASGRGGRGAQVGRAGRRRAACAHLGVLLGCGLCTWCTHPDSDLV